MTIKKKSNNNNNKECMHVGRMKNYENNNNKKKTCTAWRVYVWWMIYIYYIGICTSVVMVVVLEKYESDRINYV